MGSRDWTWAIGFGGKDLYPLSQTTAHLLQSFFFLKNPQIVLIAILPSFGEKIIVTLAF